MLCGGRDTNSPGGSSIRARANEKLPSPIKRIRSVGLKGTVGLWSGLETFLFLTILLGWEEFGMECLLLRSPSENFAPSKIFFFTLYRLCCEVRAAFRPLPFRVPMMEANLGVRTKQHHTWNDLPRPLLIYNHQAQKNLFIQNGVWSSAFYSSQISFS